MEATSFIFKECNDEDFEDYVEKANIVWEKAFGNRYEYNQCPANYVAIGFNNEDEPVCAAIFDTNLEGFDYDCSEYCGYCHCYNMKNNECIVSSVGAEPKNIGNGSKIMEKIIEFLKTKNINLIYVNITEDENKDRLIKFYDKFGFTKNMDDKKILKNEIQRCLCIS